MGFGNIKTLSVEKDGTAIDCAVFGKGGRPLVLIPGLSLQRVKGSALPLAWMYRGFMKNFTVYVLDKKDAVPAGYSIRELADDTAFVMEKLGIDQASIVGVSQGGMIAQYLAINYPALVRKLVLGVTASRVNPVMETAVNCWVEMAEQRDYKTLVMDMFRKMYSDAYLKKYGWAFPLLTRIGKPEDFSRFINLANACLTCNAYPELLKITCPTFVIGGKKDLVVTGMASEEIAEILHCDIYMYDAFGHAAYDEATDFNQKILQFLTQ